MRQKFFLISLDIITKGKLLSAFCGQGREAKFFADQGFEITGVDANADMVEGAIAYAEELGVEASFEIADFLHYRSNVRYEVVYLSPWMYGTFSEPNTRIQLLHHCAEMLAPEGVIVISYIHLMHPERLWEKVRYGISWVAAFLSRSDGRPQFGDRFYLGIFHHFFTPGELEKEVEMAGLQILEQQESENGLFDFCLLSKQGN